MVFRMSLIATMILSTPTDSTSQLFYRAKKDGPALIGLKHPWDH